MSGVETNIPGQSPALEFFNQDLGDFEGWERIIGNSPEKIVMPARASVHETFEGASATVM
ncbi:MAG: hypothetical protein JNK77_12060 [Saprospiraceae bacterium]|nr:hypothetical protein [Saprospiraceae bacterium]